MYVTCAWARADTSWWVGLAEVDATWTRAGTIGGGGQGSQKWMQHGHVLAQKGGAGLAEVDATCAWARADTTWWVGLTEVDATWTRAGTKGGGGRARRSGCNMCMGTC